jgi:hypothetical protein
VFRVHEKAWPTFARLLTDVSHYLVSRTRVFDKFTILPPVLALNDYFLDPGYNISAFHTIQINPGEVAQSMHYGTFLSTL